jgi:hypothetical protein
MWAYVYRFDKHGRFQKCKARLAVRDDQQVKSAHEEIYAAKFAGRSSGYANPMEKIANLVDRTDPSMRNSDETRKAVIIQ